MYNSLLLHYGAYYQSKFMHLPFMGTRVGTVGKVRLIEGPSVVGNTVPSQHSLNEVPHCVPNLFIRLQGNRAAWAIRPSEQHWQHSCRTKQGKNTEYCFE